MASWNLPGPGHMDRATGIYLQNMTGKEAQERLEKNDILIVPIGATEAHGPHAPSGEDTFLVTRLAEAVAERTGCTVAQPLWYGSHPYHHLGMPGTVVIPEDVLCAYIRAMIAGFWNMGFRKQIFLNGHGQEWVIPTAMHQFGKRYQVPCLLISVDWWHTIKEHVRDKAHGGPYETPFIHADECETSASLTLFPEMVKMEDAVDTTPKSFLPKGHFNLSADAYEEPLLWWEHVGNVGMEVICFPEGIVGSGTLAEAQKARPGIEACLDYLVKLHDDILKTFPVGKLPPTELFTMRDKDEVDALLKGPFKKGGKHLYTVAYPP